MRAFALHCMHTGIFSDPPQTMAIGNWASMMMVHGRRNRAATTTKTEDALRSTALDTDQIETRGKEKKSPHDEVTNSIGKPERLTSFTPNKKGSHRFPGRRSQFPNLHISSMCNFLGA